MPGTSEVMKKPTVALKVVELVLAIISSGLVLHAVQIGTNWDEVATVYVTIMGFIMVNIITIMSFVLNTPLHKLLLVTISVCAAIMFAAAGGIMLNVYLNYLLVINGTIYYKPDRLVASAGIAIINAAIYLVDAALTFKDK